MTTEQAVYYIAPKSNGHHVFYELRQTRFRGVKNHPHDVCAVGSTVQEVLDMVANYKLGKVEGY